MKIDKSDRTLFIIVGLTLILTLFANVLISLIDMKFTWQTLISATFWINIGITQILTLIPYFACINIIFISITIQNMIILFNCN